MQENGLLFDDDDDSLQFCTFYLAENLYGVNISDVKEISTDLHITPVCHSPNEVCGYVNVRGSYYLILNLKIMCGYKSTEIHQKSQIVLFKQEVGESLGVLVDTIGDIIKVKNDCIEERRQQKDSLPQGKTDRREMKSFTSGVCKLDENLMIVLNPGMMLSSINKL